MEALTTQRTHVHTNMIAVMRNRLGVAQLVTVNLFFFSSRRRHTRWNCDWSSDVCSSDLRLSQLYHCSYHSEYRAPPTAIGNRTGILRVGLNASMMTAIETYPLSFAQQRLWFLNQLDGPSPLYTILNSYRLRGDVHADALESAFGEIVARHASLRTTFDERDGEPVQVVHALYPVRVDVEDLQQLPPRPREATAGRIVAELSRQPFDLRAGPLL